jgi:microsomal dipeptidase-like Zn-dependent dipeptidase
VPDPGPISAEAAEMQRSMPVVDLLVGSAIMRPDFLARRRYGHVDLPRAREGGMDLLGVSIVTRLPDLRGTWSGPFFWSQGLSIRALRSDFATANALIDRVDGWEAASDGALRIVRSGADLAAVGGGEWVGAFLGVQGGHVLEGELANLEHLQARGLRTLALAHVMDNALVGSDTGVRKGGLTPFGRDVIAECQRLGVAVDLAHMSEAGIRDCLPLLRPPFLLSHTGFTALAGQRLWWRHYSPQTRNLPSELARDVAAAGGVIGITLSTWLLGGDTLDAFGRAVDLALELCGPDGVAVGSDMDGGLRMLVDAAGFPALTGELLRRGVPAPTIAAVMGGNALRALRGVAPTAG